MLGTMSPIGRLKKRVSPIYWRLRQLGKILRVLRPVPRGSRTHEVRVSVTSHPGRIRVAWLAVRSLLLQSVRCRVLLILSRDEFPVTRLPRRLEHLTSKGLEVIWVDGNAKCHQKIMPARDRSSIVVTADDDVLYPSWWLATLLHTHREKPDHIVAHRAREVVTDGVMLAPYATWGPANVATPNDRIFPTTVGGVLYPPGSLPDVAFNVDLALKLCPTADDVWLWAVGLLARTPVSFATEKFQQFSGVRRAQGSLALNRMNVLGGQNDVQLKAVLDHFDLWSRVLS
jgi:hypothetical protein